MPAPDLPVRVAVAIAVLWLLTLIPRAERRHLRSLGNRPNGVAVM